MCPAYGGYITFRSQYDRSFMYTASLAWILSVIVASSYVVAIRWRVPDSIGVLPRDHPSVIRFRFYRVSILCMSLLTGLPCILTAAGAYNNIKEVFSAFYLKPNGIPSALILLLVLYCGPIANYIYITRLQDLGPDTTSTFFTLDGFRDHVFAPVTEEVIYRSMIMACLLPVVGPNSSILFSPLLFGIAHIHHAYELIIGGLLPLSVAVPTGFQILYTTLFGVAAAKMFVGSRSVWCLVVLHMVCNVGGIPGPPGGGNTWKFVYVFLCISGLGVFIWETCK